jgi:hypothetical protein
MIWRDPNVFAGVDVGQMMPTPGETNVSPVADSSRSIASSSAYAQWLIKRKPAPTASLTDSAA